MQCHALPCIAPASYARTLLCIRWASQSVDICGQAALTPSETSALTLHSMKSTALASAAQLDLRRDERLGQGHHRDSARLYSRNDTFASLRVQRTIATSLAAGWRPQRSMARERRRTTRPRATGVGAHGAPPRAPPSRRHCYRAVVALRLPARAPASFTQLRARATQGSSSTRIPVRVAELPLAPARRGPLK